MYIIKYHNMTITSFDTIEEAELFIDTNNDKTYEIEEVDSPTSPVDPDTQRQSLHDSCLAAYQATGSVRSARWIAAKALLNAFEATHGREYNPD